MLMKFVFLYWLNNYMGKSSYSAKVPKDLHLVDSRKSASVKANAMVKSMRIGTKYQ